MPCWYYTKKQLINTPSFQSGIDSKTEARYRKEGARFILDAGQKLNFRHDTCATGVVYFHRFYMFQSFKDFHRYVTATTCLFLAGKVEETPKKCKDILKTAKGMLTDAQFRLFGDDPREELMTQERILLQTIKFDLMVEHPYTYLLRLAKNLKGDKPKIQQMVQMAWTFINDSLCTSLCLQWEADVIAVALLYLASRLTKSDVTDWIGKPPGFKGKWWECVVEDITLELLEDVCHNVLDLYSNKQKEQKHEDSPPPPPPPPKPSPSPAPMKRPRSPVMEPQRIQAVTGVTALCASVSDSSIDYTEQGVQGKKFKQEELPSRPQSTSPQYQEGPPSGPPPHIPPGHPPPANPTPQQQSRSKNYVASNPYVSSQMFSSSFMSQEGSQNIQSLMGAGPPPQQQYKKPPPKHTGPPPSQQGSGNYGYQPKQPPQQPPQGGYNQTGGYQGHQQSRYQTQQPNLNAPPPLLPQPPSSQNFNQSATRLGAPSQQAPPQQPFSSYSSGGGSQGGNYNQYQQPSSQSSYSTQQQQYGGNQHSQGGYQQQHNQQQYNQGGYQQSSGHGTTGASHGGAHGGASSSQQYGGYNQGGSQGGYTQSYGGQYGGAQRNNQGGQYKGGPNMGPGGRYK